jgi:hypothetical protein
MESSWLQADTQQPSSTVFITVVFSAYNLLQRYLNFQAFQSFPDSQATSQKFCDQSQKLAKTREIISLASSRILKLVSIALRKNSVFPVSWRQRFTETDSLYICSVSGSWTSFSGVEGPTLAIGIMEEEGGLSRFAIGRINSGGGPTN